MSEFDYIVVGAGSAGCVMANRLSANPSNRVLLLEAGGHDRSFWLHVPVGYFKTMHNPAFDWCYRTEPDPGIADPVGRDPLGAAVGSARRPVRRPRGTGASNPDGRGQGRRRQSKKKPTGGCRLKDSAKPKQESGHNPTHLNRSDFDVDQ